MGNQPGSINESEEDLSDVSDVEWTGLMADYVHIKSHISRRAG